VEEEFEVTSKFRRRGMKMLLLGRAIMLALAFLFPTAMAQAAGEESGAVKAELVRLEEVWNEAHRRGDFETLDRLWDDKIKVIVPKMQLINKAKGLDIFRSGRMKFLRYETSELAVHVDGETAIVTGHLLRTRRINNRELQDDWRFSKVYVRRGGVWRVLLWQASEWPS
jgi:ketosteroid isomerase-like protein